MKWLSKLFRGGSNRGRGGRHLHEPAEESIVWGAPSRALVKWNTAFYFSSIMSNVIGFVIYIIIRWRNNKGFRRMEEIVGLIFWSTFLCYKVSSLSLKRRVKEILYSTSIVIMLKIMNKIFVLGVSIKSLQ